MKIAEMVEFFVPKVGPTKKNSLLIFSIMFKSHKGNFSPHNYYEFCKILQVNNLPLLVEI